MTAQVVAGVDFSHVALPGARAAPGPSRREGVEGFGITFPSAAVRGRTSPIGRAGRPALRLSAMRLGLSHVKNLSTAARKRILEERRRAFFLSLEDFLDRAKLTAPEAEALADSGALDCFGHPRPETMWRIRLHKARAPISTLAGFAKAPPRLPPMRDLPPDEKLRLQYSALDLCAAAHPLAMTPKLDRRGLIPAKELYSIKPGARIKILGWLVTAKRHRTKKGEFMKFLTLEDETAIYEAVLFPNAYKRCAQALRGGGPFVIYGRVEDDAGYRTVTVDKVAMAAPRQSGIPAKK